jgi:alpha-tubulin suppressor-like RCC1 family protein
LHFLKKEGFIRKTYVLGQLGIGNNQNQHSPVEFSLENIVSKSEGIKKIACGQCHTLILTSKCFKNYLFFMCFLKN